MIFEEDFSITYTKDKPMEDGRHAWMLINGKWCSGVKWGDICHALPDFDAPVFTGPSDQIEAYRYWYNRDGTLYEGK